MGLYVAVYGIRETISRMIRREISVYLDTEKVINIENTKNITDQYDFFISLLFLTVSTILLVYFQKEL